MTYYTSNPELVLTCGSSEMFINTLLFIVLPIAITIGLSTDGTKTNPCFTSPSHTFNHADSDAKDKNNESVELQQGNLETKSNEYYIEKAFKLLLKNRPRKSVNLDKAILQENDSSSEDNDLLYLDIGVYGKPDLYKGEIKLTERNLLECLNFQVMLFALKNHHGSEIPEPLKTYQNMSKADIAIAVRRKCDQPLEFAKKSFAGKEKSQNERNYIRTAATTTTDLPFKLTNTESDLQIHTDKKILLRKDKRSGSSDEPEALHETATTILNNEPKYDTVDDQAIMDEFHPHHKTINLPSTLETISTIRSEITTNENQFLYQETTTDKYPVWIAHSGPNIYKETLDFMKPTESYGDWNIVTTTEVSLTDTPTTYGITNSVEMQSGLYKADLLFPETKDEKISSENYNNQDSPVKPTSSNQFNTSTTNASPIEDRTSLDMRSAGNNDDNIENSISTTQRLPVIHQEVKEADIKIPKIITKELVNGSVISNVDGYEVLPNNDFVNVTDVSTYENSTEMRLGTDATDESASPLYSGLLGPLYFVFGDKKIPTRLVQTPDGGINLALDGEKLCEKMLTKEYSSLFLKKMCSCVRDLKYTTDLSINA